MAVARWLFSPLYESHELPNMIEIILLLCFIYESHELPNMVEIILYDSCELPYMIKIIFM